MDESTVEDCIKYIQDLVFDEDTIVTYKTVSRKKDIHVNLAKELLHYLLTQYQTIDPCPISATYLVAGTTKDDSYVVSIVTDDKMDEACSKFEKITSKHVYSIQKGDCSGLVRNPEMLYAVDSTLAPPKSYPITCTDIKLKMTSEESHEVTNTNISMEVVPTCSKVEKTKENITTHKDVEKPSRKKPGHIANFFYNQAQLKKVKVEEEERPEDPVLHETEKSSKINEVTSKLSNTGVALEGKTGKKKGSRKPNSNSPEKEKKRKRIMSNSEDDDTDEEAEDALMRSEVEVPENSERVKTLEGEPDENPFNKQKKKKIVDKTIVHDDGYMETIKEVVYETDSDNEMPKKEEVVKKSGGESKPVSKAAESRSVAPKGKPSSEKCVSKKQSSLLSFFKKT